MLLLVFESAKLERTEVAAALEADGGNEMLNLGSATKQTTYK